MKTSADRISAAYFEAIEVLCEVTPKGWYAKGSSARAAVTQAGIPTLNCAYTTTLDPDLEELGMMATEVGRVGAPWSIMVRSDSASVAGLAARHGLFRRHDLPLMACAASDAVFRADKAQRKSVYRIGATESDLYTEILAEGFEAPQDAFGSLMGGGVLDAALITGYLARESDRIAGTGLGIWTRGTVGLYNIAVLPGFRGHGLGRAITETAMADGFAAGADAAYLHASAMGRPLYESMGFRLVENWTVYTAGASQ